VRECLGHGTDTTAHAQTRRPIEFNEFVTPPDHPLACHLPLQPTIDLNIKLDMRDFHWAVQPANVDTKYHVICQRRKSHRIRKAAMPRQSRKNYIFWHRTVFKVLKALML